MNKALIFTEFALLTFSVVIIEGVETDARDVSILGMADVFKPEEADVFVIAET